MKINNVVVTIIVLAVFAGIYFAKKNHKKVIRKISDIELAKDSTINILINRIDVLTHDTTQYRLQITALDSSLRLYYDKTNYLELLLNNKDRQMTSISKDERKLKFELSKCENKNDSLSNILNGYERVHVPE